MNLKEQLTEVREASARNIPTDKLSVMLAETEILKARELEKYAPKVGDVFPRFALTDQLGNEVSLSEKLSHGPVVLTFYRGGWCPYCNLELRAYQSVLDEIKAQGASLLAITPELPDASLTTAEKNALTFSVLSDPNSKFSKTLGLVFTLADSLKPIYSSFNIELEAHNGKGVFELPLAATYVIDQAGKIVFADVNADYTQRAEPRDVVESLKKICK
ncbi:peroxiredoxin-like family protein [Paraglaciecola aquimarina]|uniref:thioredoxin-dependent peroxiredoxin n=1 Tax=Paraglaciecola aquimarina TaxID=1235557 RepID=A0ABU3T1W8_9ALTE|nr:peroxiredoxin-like family protein [Paraglaciecola aquimarina]MDU0356250.1 peroxiredoxin-like family protein [Paraglaciecola aquimarina]